MQHAYEELEKLVMGENPEAKAISIIRTQDQIDLDARRSVARAEKHSKTQMMSLLKEMRRQKASKVNPEIIRSYETALAPLEVRLGRYEAVDEAERLRLLRIKERKADRAFQKMMESWVQNVDAEKVETNFLGMARWQVENAHARDLARDKWRLRAQDRKLTARAKAAVPHRLRGQWRVAESMARLAVQYVGPKHFYKPALEERLPPEEFEVRPPVSKSRETRRGRRFTWTAATAPPPALPGPRGAAGRRAVGVAGGGGRGPVRRLRLQLLRGPPRARRRDGSRQDISRRPGPAQAHVLRPDPPRTPAEPSDPPGAPCASSAGPALATPGAQPEPRPRNASDSDAVRACKE